MGRRSEPRYQISGVVQVHEGGPEGPVIGSAQMRNVSASGACVLMKEKLASGVRVYLSGLDLDMHAIVRHVGVACNGYILGLEFLRDLEPSPNNASGLPATW